MNIACIEKEEDIKSLTRFEEVTNGRVINMLCLPEISSKGCDELFIIFYPDILYIYYRENVDRLPGPYLDYMLNYTKKNKRQFDELKNIYLCRK